MPTSWKAIDATRPPYEGPPPTIMVFEPARYSKAELTFLLEYLGESPVVALEARELPTGVNEHAVRPLLQRVYDLQELLVRRQIPYCGLDALKDSIVRYIAWIGKSEVVWNRTKRSSQHIRHPSLHSFDGRRRATIAGVGADSGQMVTSEILPDGSRKPFAVDLFNADESDLLADALRDPLAGILGDEVQAAPTYDSIEVDDVNGVLTCPICRVSTNWDVDRASTKTLALARMSRHLQTAKKDVDRHRILRARVRS